MLLFPKLCGVIILRGRLLSIGYKTKENEYSRNKKMKAFCSVVVTPRCSVYVQSDTRFRYYYMGLLLRVEGSKKATGVEAC